MFVSEALKTHLETSATIQAESLVLAEWNMNMPDNISKLGNYRYRPLGSDLQLRNLPISFDNQDAGNYYTGATDADIVVDGGFQNNGTPISFTSTNEKMKMIYSLEDCIKPFRPRSGINKPLYFAGDYLPNSGANLARRPRYYMPSKYDQFKYWTSYRTEDGTERGISNNISNGNYYIDDAVPFVVYKDEVPTNRLIVKMQTNVGDIDLGPFTNASEAFNDPFYGDANRTTPSRWKIQYLKNNQWQDAYSFTENDLREDGSVIVDSDGYVELQYGLIVPDKYRDSFVFAETFSSSTLLPNVSLNGYAYLVIETNNSVGVFYIWDSATGEYETFIPNYGWYLGSEEIDNKTSFVTDLTSPLSYTNTTDGTTEYREFEYIQGIRIVVETMNKFDCTFDLIEMSPRLIVNVSDKTIEYSINKILSDLGNSALPVGQLLASTGLITLFDDDQAFNDNNTTSIVSKYIRKNIKFNFYEKILNVDGFDYWVPLKTLYSEGFPQANTTGATLQIQLRDFYFFLESMPAPRMLVTQVSLSYAISLLLDYIGFSNYSFNRVTSENDPIIPYFFIAPDQNVAEVLNQLAVSTQTAMFFDEYNNFIVMSKNYILPSIEQRSTDMVLSGTNNQTQDGIIENQSSGLLPNIFEITSENKKVYNNGKINYTTRYIQRTLGSLKQANMIDKEQSWIYKPVLLWEVAGTDNLKTVNSVVSKQGSYILGAMPLNSDLTNLEPTVVSNQLINNIIDIGENVYGLTRYNGFLYANGEIIKYDAAEFSVTGTGNVWISSNQEYQNYFSSLPFNGKIYPTGSIRIYAEPYYETIEGITRLKNGSVYQHGRAQFGTKIATHSAGLSSYWSNNDYVRGCDMKSQYLFTTTLLEDITTPTTAIGAAGVNNTKARQTSRNGIIKNFVSSTFLTETDVNKLTSTQSGTLQSSAFIMNGPSFTTTETPINFISYVYKELNNAYKHFGTRMRVVGKIENNENRTQTPIGSTTFYQVTGSAPDKNVSIGGGSGGMAILLNPTSNNGYYFEIAALTEKNIESYLNLNTKGQSSIEINNVVFYKIKKDSSNTDAIPIKLWGGLAKISVDDGRFTGQYRMVSEENPTVYDLSVEYEDIGKIRRFYLYINNNLIKVVDDPDPLPIYNNMALFTRGSSRCMFENVYALMQNPGNPKFATGETISSSLSNVEINDNESFRKYGMSQMVKSTYVSTISAQEPPKYNIYFEEFGTTMRECAYFDIKYDRAYPALYAQLSATVNKLKGYTSSGFYANSYGAEFLIFNTTDTMLNLDETTGNYLRIQGITFTQDTTHELTVDEYFRKRSNLLNQQLDISSTVYSPLVEQSKYDEIKLSRMVYGNNDFALDTPYIQTEDDANELMGWIVNKIMKPKQLIGINIFPNPAIQLGDIVTINYKNNDNINLVASDDLRFVVYNIQYSRTTSGPEMTLYLVEV